MCRKPNPGPYDKLLEKHDIDPATSVMLEDMARNWNIPLPLACKRFGPYGPCWSRDGVEAGDHVHHITDDLATWLSDYVGQKAALTSPIEVLVWLKSAVA